MLKAHIVRLSVALSVTIAAASFSGAQQSSPSSWSGWARCEINVSGQGYSDQQTHTWTMSGGTPSVSGAFRIYAATWSVVGSGSSQQTQGNQTRMVQWATNAQNLDAPLAVFVRASDGRMFIQARHAQVRAPQAVTGYQQLIIDGKPQMPGKIAAEAFEWAFPVVEVSRPKPGANAIANGSSTPVVNGKVGFMQPAGTQPTASCTWKFGEGSAAPDAPSTVAAPATPTPAGAGVATTPASGQSSSNTASCVGAPGNLVTTAVGGNVTMKWTAPSTGVAASYIIQASNQAGGPANLANFNTGNNALSLNVPNVPAGSYYLRVLAVATCGTSGPSNEVLLVVTDQTAGACPSAPQGLVTSVSGHDVNLKWQSPATGTPTSYVVQAGSAPGGANLANFDTGSTALTLVSSNVGNGSYYIRVYAKSASCAAPTFLGPASNEVLAAVP